MTAGALGACGIGLSLLGGAIVFADQSATFSARREVVRVDVLVSVQGRIVRGLTPADFEVRDNGVVQQVELASLETLPLSVILALDASSSVTGDRLRHLQAAGGAVIDGLAAGDRVALLTFSHVVAMREGLTGEAPRVRAALAAIAPGGSTSLVDAASAALLAAEPGPSRTLIIVFSDGQDTSSWLLPDRVVESARSSDATVYGVTVRGSRRPEFLRALADASGGAVIEIESTQDLSATFTRILDEFRQRYVLSYSPQGVSREGWHPLQVRVRGRRADVRARPGYVAGP